MRLKRRKTYSEVLVVTVREATILDSDIVYDLIMATAKHHDQEVYVKTNKQELINSGDFV